MSGGSSPSDFVMFLKLCKIGHAVLKDGPSEYRGLQTITKFLKGGVKSLSDKLDSLRGKLTFHTSNITVLISLQYYIIARIERQIERIAVRRSACEPSPDCPTIITSTYTASLSSQIEQRVDNVWEEIRAEMLSENIETMLTMSHRTDIIRYIKTLLLGRAVDNSLVDEHRETRRSAVRARIQNNLIEIVDLTSMLHRLCPRMVRLRGDLTDWLLGTEMTLEFGFIFFSTAEQMARIRPCLPWRQ